MKIDWWWGFLKNFGRPHSTPLLLSFVVQLLPLKVALFFWHTAAWRRKEFGWLQVSQTLWWIDENVLRHNQHLFYCPKGIFFSRCSSKIPLRNSSSTQPTTAGAHQLYSLCKDVQTLKIILQTSQFQYPKHQPICQPILSRPVFSTIAFIVPNQNHRGWWIPCLTLTFSSVSRGWFAATLGLFPQVFQPLFYNA